LVRSHRGPGNQRRYHRSMLRRISIIKIAQSLGLSLEEISSALETLPDERTPTRRDWEKLSLKWRNQLDARIANLEKLREQLSSCIGCGCLSLKRCALYNPGDRAAARGAGPRYLLGDRPENN
ncbi:MAG: redox-sensitive transcriptional activator SoxR, partial [Gammaproteobacteria bacterium]